MLAGSVGRLENVPSIQGTNDARVRERLIASGVMEVSAAGSITFPRDHLSQQAIDAIGSGISSQISQQSRGIKHHQHR